MGRIQPYRRRSTGFTLIELLVVISIIALLIAILLPSLKAARDVAKTSACLSTLRSLGIALATYANDNGELLPPGSTVTSFSAPYWFDYLDDYMGTGRDKTRLYCPSEDNHHPSMVDYGINRPTVFFYDASNRPGSLTLSSFPRPSKLIAIGDSRETANAGASYRGSWIIDALAIDVNVGIYRTWGATPWPPRHRGNMGFLWLDGHATSTEIPVRPTQAFKAQFLEK